MGQIHEIKAFPGPYDMSTRDYEGWIGVRRGERSRKGRDLVKGTEGKDHAGWIWVRRGESLRKGRDLVKGRTGKDYEGSIGGVRAPTWTASLRMPPCSTWQLNREHTEVSQATRASKNAWLLPIPNTSFVRLQKLNLNTPMAVPIALPHHKP